MADTSLHGCIHGGSCMGFNAHSSPAASQVQPSRPSHTQKRIPETQSLQAEFWQNYTPKSLHSRSTLSQPLNSEEQTELVQQIQRWAAQLGFQQLGITDIELGEHEAYLQKWLDAGYHGSMEYMARHGGKRSRPAELVPDTCRVISVRMDYLAADTQPLQVLESPQKAYISRYTLGRDYHKLLRKRLATLAGWIQARVGGGQYRAFVDSAPVLERAIAESAGLGWIAKNTMLINADAGSWFFLGEIYTDLPLPVDAPQHSKHCGTCTACLDICPTNAFTGPFQLDARKCISYLTIEHKGSIDVALRPLMGNRIFGCDDCQLVCPWNKFARASAEDDFKPRHGLADASLVELFLWDEATYLDRTEGSAIRRIGHERWLRNLAVALGNAPTSSAVTDALRSRLEFPSALVREHVEWALAQHACQAK
jgi:epoxyqueuosine reductase